MDLKKHMRSTVEVIIATEKSSLMLEKNGHAAGSKPTSRVNRSSRPTTRPTTRPSTRQQGQLWKLWGFGAVNEIKHVHRQALCYKFTFNDQAKHKAINSSNTSNKTELLKLYVQANNKTKHKAINCPSTRPTRPSSGVHKLTANK